ncbi:transcriptional regulator, LysR family [Roseivivax lentus]|uniref:Transcriptional regulator, LysR family n=1 Tax=Roseivivax lentus TaxID=633194 RepID=A0A1N7N7M7_9RHOB|nr:hydrogen peroxide-inducible genes activator [Roseivivax lentus]SIS94355.1 transcriptional regulator, LysR family [Roseivivax lentus]
MENVTLRQLRYFDALARHGHFGRAAEASSISQPALSVQIKELETGLGVRLFDRSARQVRLTALGEEFAERVRDILRAVDELGDLARASDGRLSGRLRLGIIPTVAPYLLPRLIGALAESHPGLDIHVRETLTDRLIRELGEGRIDAAIVALPVSEARLSEIALFDEAFVLIRPEAEAAEPVPDGEALARMRLLLLEEGHCFRDQALSFCKRPARLPREGLEGSSLSTLVQMVGAGIGVTLIPEMAVPVETRSAAVALARFRAPVPRRTIGMIWRASSPLAAQLTDIAEVVREAGQSAVSAAAASAGPAEPAGRGGPSEPG